VLSGTAGLYTRPERHTVDEHSVRERVHRPDVGRPVRVAQAPREGKQSAQDLRYLVFDGEGAKSDSQDGTDAATKLDAVEELDPEDGLGR